MKLGRTLSKWGIALALLGLLCNSSAEERLFSPSNLPKAKQQLSGSQCVEPVEVMRRFHMEFILHQRIKTMRQGIRTTQHSLVECINCHVAPGQSIHNQEDHFCRGCHSYVAVQIDCFDCHTSEPQAMPAAETLMPIPPPPPGTEMTISQPEGAQP